MAQAECRKRNEFLNPNFRAFLINSAKDLLLFHYSLVGFDSKADLMFWRIGDSLDAIQDMTAKLYRTNLGSWLETVDNYLSITKKMMFVTPDGHESIEDRFHVKAGAKKYHFVYPCGKHRDWYDKIERGAKSAGRRKFYGRKEVREHKNSPDARLRFQRAGIYRQLRNRRAEGFSRARRRTERNAGKQIHPARDADLYLPPTEFDGMPRCDRIMEMEVRGYAEGTKYRLSSDLIVT